MSLSSIKRDRFFIFLLFARTEVFSALAAFEDLYDHARYKRIDEHGTICMKIRPVLNQLRLVLHYTASVSKIFWPQKESKERGEWLRAKVGLPEQHPLSDRRLRNHIEHIDERLDKWTEDCPRPFMFVDVVLHDFEDRTEWEHKMLLDNCVVLYDVRDNSVSLFGEIFSLAELQAAVLDVQRHLSAVWNVICVEFENKKFSSD